MRIMPYIFFITIMITFNVFALTQADKDYYTYSQSTVEGGRTPYYCFDNDPTTYSRTYTFSVNSVNILFNEPVLITYLAFIHVRASTIPRELFIDGSQSIDFPTYNTTYSNIAGSSFVFRSFARRLECQDLFFTFELLNEPAGVFDKETYDLIIPYIRNFIILMVLAGIVLRIIRKKGFF